MARVPSGPRRWLIMLVVIPLATVAVSLVRRALEKRSGQTRLTRTLRRVEDEGRKRTPGMGPSRSAADPTPDQPRD